MINKCINSGQDIKAALLAIRNTPLKCGSSPAQLLLGRPLREHLPALPDNNTVKHTKNLLTERKEQKHQHDRHAARNTHDEFTSGKPVHNGL